MSTCKPKNPTSPRWKINFLLKVFQIDDSNQSDHTICLAHLFNFFNRLGASYVEITSLLRDFHVFRLKSDGLIASGVYDLPGKKIQDDEPCLDLWQGFMEVEESTASFANVIYHLTGSAVSVIPVKKSNEDGLSRNIGFLWKFVEENDERFENLSDFPLVCTCYDQPVNLKGFSLGNIINGTKFVEQFNSLDKVSSKSNLQSEPDRILSPQLNLRHSEEFMELIFEVGYDRNDTNQWFKLVYDYDSVKRVTISRSESGLSVYFHLSHPPKIYILTQDMDPGLIDMRKSQFWSFDYYRYRLEPSFKQTLKKESWTRWHDCRCISSTCIGKSSVLAVNLLNDKNLLNLIDLVSAFYVWRRYSALEISFGYVEVIKGSHRPLEMISDFPFAVNYALQCIQSISYSFQDDLIVNNQLDEVISFIRQKIVDDHTESMITALYKLCNDYFFGEVYHALSRLQSICKRTQKEWPSMKKIKSSSNPYIKHLRRVILTPTRVLMLPENAFQTSLFLEVVGEHLDSVLRLSLHDEDMTNLGFAVARNEEDCKRHEKRRMSQGFASELPSPEMYFLGKCLYDRLIPSFHVAGKDYIIYGASSSQLRQNGMILYAKDALGRDAVSIRNQIGLIKASEISKYISRIGLSLTQVMAFVELPDGIQIRYTKDVLAGIHPKSKNPYNFTDGCGLMSYELAEYIWSDLKSQGIFSLNPEEPENIPTAYQIRFMGCKGMIVVDTTLIGKVIVLRESMRKVDAEPGKIGIVKISEPRRAYLNRPLVTILNQIGLKNDYFVKLLSDAIGDLVDSFHHNDKASKALFMFSDLHRFIDHVKLSNLGYDLLGDPFFRSALELVFHQGLDVIKQKARIPLDLDTSRTLFGVADPTGTHHLPYIVVPTREDDDDDDDQFIEMFDQSGHLIHSAPVGDRRSLFFDEATELVLTNATPRSSNNRKGLLKHKEVFIFPSDLDEPLKGEVIVTKFPCMHPGDVRRLIAVDRPELHGIRDCIVFPVDGPRPHANQMAGSDLDGDEYCVIWSKDFMAIKIFDPMDFPDESNNKKFVISNEEIAKFYMRYLQDCTVGRIASAHLVWADMLPQGIFDTRCIKLAKKYAISLDFAKTGISETLSKEERYREAPDLTQNWSKKPSYHSARALGAIYRTISMFELFLAEETSKLKVIDSLPDPRLKHRDWKKYQMTATNQHEIYCAIVSHLLDVSQFGNEIELFTQLNEKSVMFGSVDSRNNNSPDHQDSMIYCINNLLVKLMEENFYHEFNSEQWKTSSADELKQAQMAKASAYYMVSMMRSKNAKKSFCGFPWIAKYSNHLFDLLRESKNNQLPNKRLTVQCNQSTVAGGFSGPPIQRRQAAESCWKFLSDWLSQYLSSMNADNYEYKRIMSDMRGLFETIVDFYIKNDRKTRSPSEVLQSIFRKIKSKQKSLHFQNNLFDACNDPIGLMTVLILERTYYEGTSARKIPDGSFNCWSNSTYRVLHGKNSKEEEIGAFICMLNHISGSVRIVHTPERGKDDCYKLSVFGSRASILICQAIIGLHNRLKSSHPHYQNGM